MPKCSVFKDTHDYLLKLSIVPFTCIIFVHNSKLHGRMNQPIEVHFIKRTATTRNM